MEDIQRLDDNLPLPYTEPNVEQEAIIIEFLKRLYDPHPMKYRRTQRTTLMAKAFIQLAIEHEGYAITFHDHYPGSHGLRSMEDILRRLCHNSNFVINKNSIKYEGITKNNNTTSRS